MDESFMRNIQKEFEPCQFHTVENWEAQHSAVFSKSEESGFIVNDGSETDWHIIRVRDPLYVAEIKLTAIVEPMPECDTDFYVNHWGGIVVCSIGQDGKVRKKGTSEAVTCEVLEDGRYRIEAIFNNRHETISVGVTNRFMGPRYQGMNRNQWRIFDLEISRKELTIEGVEKLVVVDVGARGGADGKWLVYNDQIEIVLIEPHPIEAQRLRDQGYTVIDKALSNVRGKSVLNITRLVGCSSLLEPNHEVLSRFQVAPAFEVTSTVEIDTERYDALYSEGGAPKPDIIKIDVQGFEYEVLEGFGELLHDCSAIELEAHFYEIYRGQKLLGDLVNFLDGFGFALRKLAEQPNFDGERLEFNAFFTKRPSVPSSDKYKLAFIEKIWQLNIADGGRRLVQNVHVAK